MDDTRSSECPVGTRPHSHKSSGQLAGDDTRVSYV